jgi:type II secretory pathway component PulM
MNHEFTPRERTLLGVFFLIVVGIIYFLAVDQPVRNGIAAAQTEAAAMQEQVDAINEKVKAIENIR